MTQDDMAKSLNHPEAMRHAYANAIQQSFTATDIKRAFMEGVVALAAEQDNPAPQWLVDRLWNESGTKAVAERKLQST